MQSLSVTQLKQEAGEQEITATLKVQLTASQTKTTKTGNPYLAVTFADAADSFTIKIWQNSPLFSLLKNMETASFLKLRGGWTQNQYGVNPAKLNITLLTEEEIEEFLQGNPNLSEKQKNDWKTIVHFVENLKDPRLHSLCQLFINTYEKRFRRTAAARKNHHARRGGLVEHTAHMMRLAQAICAVYPEVNTDLILAGVLLHDCGKMWENTYPEKDFVQCRLLEGELLGHIPIGMTICQELWQKMLEQPEAKHWENHTPSTENVRLHLLHLIASHHGQYDFGSPTLPRTPEAIILHHIDNIDAKYEMMRDVYESKKEIVPGIYERAFPLPTDLVEPLANFENKNEQTQNQQTEMQQEKKQQSASKPPISDEYLGDFFN